MRGLLAVVLVGCYAPQLPEGAPCAENGACPVPLLCSAGHCVTEAVHDARGDGFAGSDAPRACTPIAVGAGALAAPMIHAPVIDGDLADWPTCFVTIDATSNPTRDLGANGMFPSGRFSIARDASHIYVAAEVMGVLPLGTQPPPMVYLNNSISLYVDGNGHAATAMYDLHAAQIVIDHANHVQSFRNGAEVVLANVASAAHTNQATYTIELSIEPSTLGMFGFGPTLGFDIGFEGGDGTVQSSEVLWVQTCGAPVCGCQNGVVAPYCDARELGVATL
ncbi:MAG TPA: sugar-binding protein [Kofleriaceae bacterium]|nr:sugar-binding protein [Kofleriaceae bacterium]